MSFLDFFFFFPNKEILRHTLRFFIRTQWSLYPKKIKSQYVYPWSNFSNSYTSRTLRVKGEKKPGNTAGGCKKLAPDRRRLKSRLKTKSLFPLLARAHLPIRSSNLPIPTCHESPKGQTLESNRDTNLKSPTSRYYTHLLFVETREPSIYKKYKCHSC